MSVEVDAQKCEACDEVILTDHEEHHTDEFGLVWHHWCAEDHAEAVMENFVEEEAIEEAREDGEL
jgi:hypothetical protein